MSGFFITFEGIEGCGKSTQVELLRAHLEENGYQVEVMREPGGTRISEQIRDILLDSANREMSHAAEVFLYEAARAQLVEERIRPALEAGTIVICDRFYDSTTAYQGAGRGISRAFIEELHRLATDNLHPDVTFLLDVSVEVGLARAKGEHAPDRIESEPAEFHNRVREGFLELARHDPERIKVVQGENSPEDVAEIIRELTVPLLKRRRTTEV